MKPVYSFLCAAIVFFASCSKPQPPKYLGYSNVRLEKASLAASVVAADLRFYNPNRYALQLKEADMDVFLNDKKVGHSRVDSLLTLPGRDTLAVPLRVQVAARDMMGPMAGLLLNPNVRLRLKGTARVGRSGVFINMPIDYEATQHIELSQLDSLLAPARQ